MFFHSEGKGFCTPNYEPGVEGVHDSSHKGQGFSARLDEIVSPDDDATHSIKMTAQILSGTVDDDVGPQLEGPLENRAHERVVDDELRLLFTGYLGDGGEIRDDEGRVTGCFNEDQLRLLPDRLLHAPLPALPRPASELVESGRATSAADILLDETEPVDGKIELVPPGILEVDVVVDRLTDSEIFLLVFSKCGKPVLDLLPSLALAILALDSALCFWPRTIW